MKADTTNQHALSSLLEDIVKKLASSMKQINEEHQALEKRSKDIIDRQDALTYKHGGEHAKPSDIICLNVRGTELFARRDTLTIVKGSRLEALFSGRWENRLLRDGKGRVFVDIDPAMLKKILEYLYMVKISEDVPPLPEVIKTKKDMFGTYVDFFKLRSGSAEAGPETIAAQETVSSSTMDEKEMMAKMTQELDTIEEKLKSEESFVAFFTKPKGIGSKWIGDKLDDSSSCISYESADLSSTDSKKRAEENGIIHLYLNAEIIAYRVDTLCGDMTSLLARNLSDALWVHDNTIVTENGKACVLMEYPGVEFKALVDHFHLKSITGEGDKEVQLSTVSDYMPRLIKHFNGEGILQSLCNVDGTMSPSSDETARSHCDNIDSTILSSKVEEENITEWLASAGKTSTPKLLYRASRDGWGASDFHRMCDGKGATVTVVKSSGGYIFGGYTDVAWSGRAQYKSSAESFLFSLKDHPDIGPVKMPIKSGMMENAVGHYSNLGPKFGRGGDLRVFSNANSSSKSTCNVGSTYQLPSNISDPHFLTGSKNFTVSEYEVFLV